MTSAERVELIDRYKQGYAEVATALAGIVLLDPQRVSG